MSSNVAPAVIPVAGASAVRPLADGDALRLYGSSSGYVGLVGAASAGSTTYTLPAADGTSGQVLTTNASGTLSWSTATTSPAGSDTEIQFNNAGVFGASSSLTWDGTTLKNHAGQIHATDDGTAVAFMQGSSSNLTFFGSTASESVRIGNSNNYSAIHIGSNIVGINETSPGGQLHTTASSATTIGLIVEGAAAASVDQAQFNPNGVTAGERARITSAGEFSNTGGFANSEQFGAGSVLGHADSTIFGAGNSTGAQYQTLLGSAVVGGSGARVVGVGEGITFPGGLSRIIILSPVGTPGGVHANGFFAGSPSSVITDVYFAEGATDATPTAYTIHGTGGSGTDIAGADLTLAGGIGTGTGVGGDVIIQYAAAGASSSTPNSLATAVTIDGDTGLVGVGLSVAKGSVDLVAGDTNPALVFSRNSATTTKAMWVTIDSDEPVIHTTNASINFKTNWNSGSPLSGLYLASTGLNGMGTTTNTSARLKIVPSSSTNIGQIIELAAAQSANAFEINSNGGSGGDLVVVDSAGLVGIGTDPDTPIHVRGAGAIIKVDTVTTSSFAELIAKGGGTTEVVNWGSTAAGTRFGTSRADLASVYSNGSSGGFAIGTLDSVPLTIGTNDTAALTIDSSQNVGIGTMSPDAMLDIEGTGAQQLRLKRTDAGLVGLQIAASGGTDFYLYKDNSPDTFSISPYGSYGTAGIYIQAGGNVGVGKLTPGARLHTTAASATDIGQIIELAAAQSANAFEINSNGGSGGDLVVVDSSGNVGIGTASPDDILHVAFTDTSNYNATSILTLAPTIRVENLQNSNDGVAQVLLKAGPGIAAIGAEQVASNSTDIYFQTTYNSGASVQEVMRISQDGNVGIGTASPGAQLHTTEGRIVNTTRITSNTTLDATHHNIFCDTDGGAFTVTLPAGVDGTVYRIINCGTSGNDVTITPDGAELLTGVNASKTASDGTVVDLVYETTEGWY